MKTTISTLMIVITMLGVGVSVDKATIADKTQSQSRGKSKKTALCTDRNYDKYLNHKHGPIPGQPISVDVELPKYDYAIGEPIVMHVKLTNQTSEPFSMLRSDSALRLYLSQDGKTFSEYQEGLEPYETIQRQKQALKPGDAWEFQRTILFCWNSEDRLVFRDAGRFYVFADFATGEDESSIYDSEVVSFRVEEPTGDDLEAFSLLRDEDGTYRGYGYFVREQTNDLEVVKRFDHVIQRYPGSAYAPALRDAIQKAVKSLPTKRPTPEEQSLYDRLRAEYLGGLPEKKP